MPSPHMPARIPIPPARRWLAFREQVLPVGVFVCAALGSAMIWRACIASPSVVAEVEQITAQVRPGQPGTLEMLTVTPLQHVSAGQVLGSIRVSDPSVAAASLAVIRAEIASLRQGMEPMITARRVALESSRVQLEWMQARVDLADLRASLQLAEDALRRTAALHAEGMATDEALTSSRTTCDGLRARVNAQEEMVVRLSPELEALSHTPDLSPLQDPDATLAAAIRVQEEKLRLAELRLQPLPLLAPMDGIVSSILRHPGESLLAGEPVLTITSAQATRVIGFLRQPLPAEPPPGSTVEIRTRRRLRSSAPATVLEVAPHLEPIPPTLLAAARSPGPELGLRIHFTAPRELALLPGEQVDVLFRPNPVH